MSKNRIHASGAYRYEEKLAGDEDILPGMLLMKNADDEVVVHDTEGGRAAKMFALEDALFGKTVDETFDEDNPVPIIIPDQGGKVNALLEGGYEYTIGMELISAGNGKLKPASQITSGLTVEEVIAYCEETADLSTESTDEDTLVAVQVA